MSIVDGGMERRDKGGKGRKKRRGWWLQREPGSCVCFLGRKDLIKFTLVRWTTKAHHLAEGARREMENKVGLHRSDRCHYRKRENKRERGVEGGTNQKPKQNTADDHFLCCLPLLYCSQYWSFHLFSFFSMSVRRGSPCFVSAGPSVSFFSVFYMSSGSLEFNSLSSFTFQIFSFTWITKW